MFNPKRLQLFLAAGLLTATFLLIGLAFAQSATLALNPPAIQSLKPVAAAAPNLTGAYRGTITMRSPIPVGSLDFAVDIVGSGSALTGRISISRTLIYDNIPALTGTLANSTAVTPTFTLTSAPFADTISGRAVQRQLAFSGYVIQAGEVLSGTVQETITGFTPQPLTALGTFMAVRPPTNVPTTLTLQVGAAQINPGQQTTLIATVNDQANQPLPGVVVIFQSTLGTFSISNGVTNNQGQVTTAFVAGTVTGAAKVTILAEAIAARSQIQIGQPATATPTATNTSVPTPTFTPVTPTATRTVTPTPIKTATPTVTRTATATATKMNTATNTAVATSTNTATATNTVPPTATFTPPPTLTPTPTPPPVNDVIFDNGFETNLTPWTGTVNPTGLSVPTIAALVGAKGLRVIIANSVATYLIDDTPASERRYRARFYFDPNSLTMAEGDSHIIFAGYQGTTALLLQMELRRSGGRYQLRAGLVNDNGGWKYTPYYTMRDEPMPVEVDWRAAPAAGANNGNLALWLDSAPFAQVTGVDNDTQFIDRVALGAVAGLDAGTSGRYYFDAFASRRQSYLGMAELPANNLLFADGFEFGNLLSWSGRAIGGGDLSVTTVAALADTKGLQAVINDNTTMYVTDDSAAAETRYRTRFYLDPNTLLMAQGNAFYYFYGYQGDTTIILRGDLRYYNGQYQVRFGTLNDGTTWHVTTYTTITDAPHWLEVEWRAASAAGANDGVLGFWLDGVFKQMITTIDNDTRRIDRARMGLFGIDTSTRGTLYFDAYAAHRRNYIGAATAGMVLAAAEISAESAITEVEAPTTTLLISTTVQDGSALVLTGQTADRIVTIAAPANSLPLAAKLIVQQTDATTLPDGYELLGEPLDLHLLDGNGLPLTPLAQPLLVTVQSAAVVDSALTVQRWNPTLAAWELTPASIDTAAQTVTLTITEGSSLAFLQPAIPDEALVEETTTSLFLPLIVR